MIDTSLDLPLCARQLIEWFDKSVRPFLETHAPDRLQVLEDDRQRLERWLDLSDRTTVCLLGASGIGKSTLLNAIVAGDRTVVPAGGVGPLTALATEVHYSEEPRIRVQYHPRSHLWRVAFALNAQVTRARQVEALAPTLRTAEVDEAEQREILESITAERTSDQGSAQTRTDEFLRQAKLIVAGNQNAERSLEYLADALAAACGHKPTWGTEPSSEDVIRLTRVSQALKLAEKKQIYEHAEAGNKKGFQEVLREHAAGFLAPLIARIEVGWPAESLRSGLVLVDLPGVGVAGDVYRKVTQRFVRETARAVIVVIDRAGVTDSVMDLLRTSGYWDRLVLSSDDPESDPCALLLAVTRVDDVANEERSQIEPDEDGKRPTKAHVFEDVKNRLSTSMRAQFDNQLKAFVEADANDAIRVARHRARETLVASLGIHPVSAPEYRRMLADDVDDRTFLESPEQSGLPGLQRSLKALVDQQRAVRCSRLEEISARFGRALSDQLSLVESSWREATRASEEAEQIRRALETFLQGQQEEYATRRASFRNFLQETVPEKIRAAILEAKDEAQKSVRRYLNGLRDAHWATLRAAVRRGGTFYGSREINLPTDIAVRFQEPVAAVWSQALLKDIRKSTYSLANDIREMVDEICSWATDNAGAFSDPKVIEMQRKAVSGQVEQLREVGREAIDDLRAAIKSKVVEAIEKPIRKSCETFVAKGDDIGPGVKWRILLLFESLAEESADAARKPAESTLQTQYKVVRAEIQKAFDDWGNPLNQTADAIVERHEERIRRSDAQRRVRVLSDMEVVRGRAPGWVMPLVQTTSTEAVR